MAHWRDPNPYPSPANEGCAGIIALVITVLVCWFLHAHHWFGLIP